MTPIDLKTQYKYAEKYRVYKKQYLINGWKSNVKNFEEFIKKVN